MKTEDPVDIKKATMALDSEPNHGKCGLLRPVANPQDFEVIGGFQRKLVTGTTKQLIYSTVYAGKSGNLYER